MMKPLIVIGCIAASTAGVLGVEPAAAPTVYEQIAAMRQELNALHTELAETKQLVAAARADLNATRTAIDGDPQTKARFELWKKERELTEREQRQLVREKAKLSGATQSLDRTLRVTEQQTAEQQAAIERARQQPTTAEPPAPGSLPPGSLNPGSLAPGMVIGGSRVVVPGTAPMTTTGRVIYPKPPTTAPGTVSPTLLKESGDARVSNNEDSMRGTATPMQPLTVSTDPSAAVNNPQSLADLRARYESLKMQYPSQYRPPNSAYRLTDLTPANTPSVQVQPQNTTGSTQLLNRTQVQQNEIRYPSSTTGSAADRSRYRVSDK
jgi:hypothetical protein